MNNHNQQNNSQDDLLERRIRLSGQKARQDAEFHGTYIVYMDKNRNLIKEFPNGTKVIMKKAEK